MNYLKTFQALVFTAIFSLSLISSLKAQEKIIVPLSPPAQTTTSSSGNQVTIKNQPAAIKSAPISVQEDPSNELGLIYSVKKLEEATKLIENNNLNDAEILLASIKDWLTEAAEHHYSLFQTLSKNYKNQNISKIEKAHALDFANLRDQSYFLLAKVYIGQNKLKPAIKLLLDIIKSQPDSELSQKAYKLIQDIKFSDKATN